MRKQLINYISIILLIIISLSSKAFTNSYLNKYKGLRYAVYNSIDSDIGAINVLIRAGSIYDPEKKYGVAYILSKLLKRGGTEKFSTNALLNKLDETGIELSTGCSKDFIFISLKFINKEKKDAMDLLKEVLLHPVFNKKEFLSIKKETASVITSYQNNNDYLAIHQGAVSLIKNKAYSHSSFGEKKDIKNISIKDVKRFYKKYFVLSNMIITFAGNFNEKKVEYFFKKNFSKLKENVKTENIIPEFSNAKKTIFKEKNLKQSYIYFLFPSFGLKSSEYYPIKILSFVLGGNLTSILAEKIRKEKGLAYSVFSTNYSMVNGGFFIIGMQTENSKAEEAIKSVIEILKNLKHKGVEKSRIKLAKDYITGSLLISLQSLNNIASEISSGIFLSKPIPPWKFDIKNLNAVTPESVNATITKIFNFKRMIISIVGKK